MAIKFPQKQNKILGRSNIYIYIFFSNQSVAVTDEFTDSEEAIFFLKVNLVFCLFVCFLAFICWPGKIY